MPKKRSGILDELKLGLVILTLIFIFLLVYKPHIGYNYPLHTDEWMHLNNAISGNLIHREAGFYFFLYPLSFVFNLMKIYQFLPAIWAVVMALSLFGLMIYLTKNYWTSLFSMLFLATLKSNVNLMGTWFFVPFIFVLPFCYLTICFLIKGIETRRIKFFIFSIISLIYIILTHASIGALLFIICVVYMLSRFKDLIKNKYKEALFCLIPLLVVLILTQITGLLSIEQLILYATYSFDKTGDFIAPFSVPIVYGLLAFILAIFGAFYALKDKKQKILVIWCIMSIIPIITFNLFENSFIIRIQRVFYYLMIGLVPLSAIGLYNLIRLFNIKFGKRIAMILSIILIILVFVNSFYIYYDLNAQTAAKGNIDLYHCYEPASNQSLNYQLTHSRCFPQYDYSALEPLLKKRLLFPA